MHLFLSCYIKIFPWRFINCTISVKIRLHALGQRWGLFTRWAVLTFLTLSSSTGLVCCRRKKALVILQNFTRVLLEIGGHRHRMVHLMTPGPAMLEVFSVPSPRSNVTPRKAWALKTFPICRMSLSWTSIKAKRTFLPIFVLDSASKGSHGVFRSKCY